MSLKRLFINGLLRYPASLRTRLRVIVYRMLGARIGRRCWMQDVWIPRNPWSIELEEGTSLDRHVVLLVTSPPGALASIVIRRDTYINRFTIIDAADRIEIGRNCMIGPHCFLTDHDHRHGSDCPISEQGVLSSPVYVGHNVWIGAGVIILKGVHIGDNAVIGAGAVVTHDVQAFQVVAGVPARQIGVNG